MTKETNLKTRELPFIESDLPDPVRPISFVCVKFSNEFEHNILKSGCVHSPLNEFIVIDNTDNQHFQTLGQAMNVGINQANNELIVVVHEDVVLLPGWQSLFEHSLTQLETDNQNWLVLGVIGRTNTNRLLGCCSDPRGIHNPEWRGSYEEVSHIDEQIIILQKSKALFPDPDLPTIHNYGKDLIRQARERGSKSYVLRAPTVHKYADSQGNMTLKPEDSVKMKNRNNDIYKLHKTCSDEYFYQKWPDEFESDIQRFSHSTLSAQQTSILNSPIILVGDQDSLDAETTRYIESDGASFDNRSTVETTTPISMKSAIIKCIFRKFQCPSAKQKTISQTELYHSAIYFLDQVNWTCNWGFAVEESAYILDELLKTFPNAKFNFVQNQRTENFTINAQYLSNELGRTLLHEARTSQRVPQLQSANDNDNAKFKLLEEYRISTINEFTLQLQTAANSALHQYCTSPERYDGHDLLSVKLKYQA